MNIAETIKDKYDNGITPKMVISVCNDFAIETTHTNHGVTYDFIDDSVLVIKTSEIYPLGYSVLTQDKRV